MPLEAQATTRVRHGGNFTTFGINTGLEEPGTAQQREDTANLSWKQTLSLGVPEVHQTTLSTRGLSGELLNSSNSPRYLMPQITCISFAFLYIFITSHSDRTGINQTYFQQPSDTQFDRYYLKLPQGTALKYTLNP